MTSPFADPEEWIIVGSAPGLRREARIDLDAFAQNIRRLTARHGAIALDVRADAHGHSLELLAPVARQLGVAGFVSSGRTDLPPAGHLEVVSSAAYGIDSDTAARPVMTLVGEVVAVKPAAVGSGVSYGYSYRTIRNTTLALVGLGYADGVPRLASNLASVRLGGGIHPVVGRIAMDQFVVESGGAAVEVGDEVTLFGDPTIGYPSAQQWAAQTGRSALELTAGIGQRVRRVSDVRDG